MLITKYGREAFLAAVVTIIVLFVFTFYDIPPQLHRMMGPNTRRTHIQVKSDNKVYDDTKYIEAWKADKSATEPNKEDVVADGKVTSGSNNDYGAEETQGEELGDETLPTDSIIDTMLNNDSLKGGESKGDTTDQEMTTKGPKALKQTKSVMDTSQRKASSPMLVLQSSHQGILPTVGNAIDSLHGPERAEKFRNVPFPSASDLTRKNEVVKPKSDRNIHNSIVEYHDKGMKDPALITSVSGNQNDNNLGEGNTNTQKVTIRHAGKAIKRFPQVIIIGVKKGGTRALLQFLALHPRIKACKTEVHFFDRHYDKGLSWYREQMPESFISDITIEKTPAYYVTPDVPRRIYDMQKSTKLIVTFRDPVIRAISDYAQAVDNNKNKRRKKQKEKQLRKIRASKLKALNDQKNTLVSNKSTGTEHKTSKNIEQIKSDLNSPETKTRKKRSLHPASALDDFDMATTTEDINLVVRKRKSIDPTNQANSAKDTKGIKKRKSFESMVFINKMSKVVDPEKMKVKIGMYAEHLKRWYKYFPRTQMYFVSSENLVRKPWEELEGLQKFLNLSVVVNKDYFWYNETKKFYCLLAKRKSGELVNQTHCLGETKGRSHPFVNKDTIGILRDFYRPYNKEFYKLSGRDFKWP